MLLKYMVFTYFYQPRISISRLPSPDILKKAVSAGISHHATYVFLFSSYLENQALICQLSQKVVGV